MKDKLPPSERHSKTALKKLEQTYHDELRKDEFLQLKECIKDIPKILDKILYLERAKADYLQNRSLTTLIASGTVLSATDLNEEIFFDKLLSEEIKYWESLLNRPSETKKILEQPLQLKDLITHAESEKIANNLKIKFKNIKGKKLKLLLIALQDLELLPKERIAKKFHECCKNYFDWNIAEYQAMNDYKFNSQTDNNELIQIKSQIESIISQSQ